MIPSAMTLALALALDVGLGEPPNRLHPVAWLGRAAAAILRAAPASGALRQLAFGAVVAIGLPLAAAAAACALLGAFEPGSAAALLIAAPLLKTTLSVRALGEAASGVRDALARGDLPGARFGLRSLCSRDAARLEEPGLIAATVESLAENCSDALVAPVVYYVLFGLPGAVAYRAVNTLDSMIGYHGRFEYLGKAAARLDDLANLVPARITAVLLLAAGALLAKDARRGLAVLRRDGATTESPNAGRPMAAMAGLLGVELEKAGHYRLGDAIETPTVFTIDDARAIVAIASALAAIVAVALLGSRHAAA